MSGFIYLATPYSHPDAAVREQRYRTALFTAARQLEKGFNVYSPVVHCHPISVSPEGYEGTHARWMEHCLAMLAQADELLIVRMDGWEESKGVAMEKAFAEAHGIPWRLL